MLQWNLFISCVKEAGKRSDSSPIIYRAEGLPVGHVLGSVTGRRTDISVFFMILIGGWFYKAGWKSHDFGKPPTTVPTSMEQ